MIPQTSVPLNLAPVQKSPAFNALMKRAAAKLPHSIITLTLHRASKFGSRPITRYGCRNNRSIAVANWRSVVTSCIASHIGAYL